MPDKTFDLGDYVTVPERISLFYELFAQGRLVTTSVQLTTEPDGKPRVMVEAAAYRSPEDTLPGRGWSWMLLPGTSNFTRGSELENAETSAWGRAIASLGILTAGGIASNQEVASKQQDDAAPARDNGTVTQHGPDGLIGSVERGRPPVDMETRATPNGPAWGFKLAQGRKGFQALATGPLAEVLAVSGLEEGTRVTVWGRIEEVPWEKKQADGSFKKMPPYLRVHIERLQTPEWTLPGEDGLSAADALTLKVGEHRDDDEPVEAESAPLPWEPLTDEEKEAIAGSLPA